MISHANKNMFLYDFFKDPYFQFLMSLQYENLDKHISVTCVCFYVCRSDYCSLDSRQRGLNDKVLHLSLQIKSGLFTDK